jgi:hypothetical protein
MNVFVSSRDSDISWRFLRSNRMIIINIGWGCGGKWLSKIIIDLVGYASNKSGRLQLLLLLLGSTLSNLEQSWKQKRRWPLFMHFIVLNLHMLWLLTLRSRLWNMWKRKITVWSWINLHRRPLWMFLVILRANRFSRKLLLRLMISLRSLTWPLH